MATTQRRSTTDRGYGHTHQQQRRRWQRVIDDGRGCCWRCGARIPAGSSDWHLGHDDDDRRIYRGAECILCNLRAAARKTNRIRRFKRALRNRRTTTLRW